MIPLYQAIGKIVLKTVNFNSLPEKEQKLLIVKQYCNELNNYKWPKKVVNNVVNNVDNNVKDDVGRLLELNLDTTKKVCYFSQGTQLIPEKKDELLVFSNYSPNDPSIYAAQISLNPLVQLALYN